MSKVQNGSELPHVVAPKTSAGRLDEKGREIPDPTPLEIAIAEQVSGGLGDIVQAMVTRAMREYTAHLVPQGQDDEDDWDDPEDTSTLTQYSVDLQDRAIQEALARQQRAQARPDEGDVEPDLDPPPEPKAAP